MGKYLGLSETFGRSKRDVFTGMVDNIRQRSQSWTIRFLSGAGKHVMLQSVLTSLPTYSMSTFKIPSSLCRRIQSILTTFWWDSSPDKRKIAWVAWSVMVRPKCLGGLGFKNIEDYNDSLLGKLSWRLQSNPNSLLAQVLKGKYFPDCSFLESVDKTGSSHGWTSIQVGKEVLKKGLGFIVGSGENISVWSDHWLSSLSPSAPIGPPTLSNQNLKVADLMNPQTNEWDLNTIRQHLPQYEDIIRLIIPSSSRPLDRLVWLSELSGKYSTKSGYRKLFEDKAILTPDSFNWMSNVWKLHSPPKLHHFLWRALNNALPVGTLLATRGIDSELKCKRCGELETIHHLLLSCPFAAEVWFKAPLVTLVASVSPDLSLKAWLALHIKEGALPPLGLTSAPLTPWLLWNLWTARNKLIFEDKIYQVEEVILKAAADARAWEISNAMKLKKKQERISPAGTRLNPTPSCCIDGAWQETSSVGGMGWIIKNVDGEVLCRGSFARSHVCSALMAVALALREALRKAKELNLQCLQVFSDSKVLVSTLRSGLDMNEIAGVLQDIQFLATLFCPLSFIYIRRLEDSQADSLAKSSISRFINVV